MIQVNGLKKAFDGFVALNGVDMHVEKGAIYGLVGPNGAGKFTLIRHLTGVYRPDQGEVQIDGENVYENKAVKSKIAYIPDELFYFMQADTMEMKRFYEGIYPSFDGKLFYRMQEFFPNIDVKRNIRRLSKGMQKQVAFLACHLLQAGYSDSGRTGGRTRPCDAASDLEHHIVGGRRERDDRACIVPQSA